MEVEILHYQLGMSSDVQVWLIVYILHSGIEAEHYCISYTGKWELKFSPFRSVSKVVVMQNDWLGLQICMQPVD